MATPEQLAALQAVVPAAQASARRWGVPASVTLAQWIFESSWGTSQLAIQAHNFFGVKANGNANLYMAFNTAEYESGRRTLVHALFAKYVSAEQSFDAHGSLLATAARYKSAMASAHNPAAFAAGLQRCGYSTNPHYALDLIGAIHEYNLNQYDVPAAPAQETA